MAKVCAVFFHLAANDVRASRVERLDKAVLRKTQDIWKQPFQVEHLWTINNTWTNKSRRHQLENEEPLHSSNFLHKGTERLLAS